MYRRSIAHRSEEEREFTVCLERTPRDPEGPVLARKRTVERRAGWFGEKLILQKLPRRLVVSINHGTAVRWDGPIYAPRYGTIELGGGAYISINTAPRRHELLIFDPATLLDLKSDLFNCLF